MGGMRKGKVSVSLTSNGVSSGAEAVALANMTSTATSGSGESIVGIWEPRSAKGSFIQIGKPSTNHWQSMQVSDGFKWPPNVAIPPMKMLNALWVKTPLESDNNRPRLRLQYPKELPILRNDSATGKAVETSEIPSVNVIEVTPTFELLNGDNFIQWYNEEGSRTDVWERITQADTAQWELIRSLGWERTGHG